MNDDVSANKGSTPVALKINDDISAKKGSGPPPLEATDDANGKTLNSGCTYLCIQRRN